MATEKTQHAHGKEYERVLKVRQELMRIALQNINSIADGEGPIETRPSFRSVAGWHCWHV